jgi:hypothetical protein
VVAALTRIETSFSPDFIGLLNDMETRTGEEMAMIVRGVTKIAATAFERRLNCVSVDEESVLAQKLGAQRRTGNVASQRR